mmetsp:Transcript_13213/g.32090  ORF Transcript_13213/g.32090 Transcript_13213/m.32090 type:complete len:248 (-) Transcript_13213:385-1128(-)
MRSVTPPGAEASALQLHVPLQPSLSVTNEASALKRHGLLSYASPPPPGFPASHAVFLRYSSHSDGEEPGEVPDADTPVPAMRSRAPAAALLSASPPVAPKTRCGAREGEIVPSSFCVKRRPLLSSWFCVAPAFAPMPLQSTRCVPGSSFHIETSNTNSPCLLVHTMKPLSLRCTWMESRRASLPTARSMYSHCPHASRGASHMGPITRPSARTRRRSPECSESGVWSLQASGEPLLTSLICAPVQVE